MSSEFYQDWGKTFSFTQYKIGILFQKLNLISGESLVNSILDICVGRYDIGITVANFLKVFNIANSNVKILRSVKREINDFKEIRWFFKEQMASFADQDRIDAIFEFQAWMEEKIVQAQMRVSEENGFLFEGTNMMNEAGHIANMTNQLRAILFDIRTEILGYQQNHGVTGTKVLCLDVMSLISAAKMS